MFRQRTEDKIEAVQFRLEGGRIEGRSGYQLFIHEEWMSVVHHEGRGGGQFLNRGQEWISVVHVKEGLISALLA